MKNYGYLNLDSGADVRRVAHVGIAFESGGLFSKPVACPKPTIMARDDGLLSSISEGSDSDSCGGINDGGLCFDMKFVVAWDVAGGGFFYPLDHLIFLLLPLTNPGDCLFYYEGA